MNPRNVAQDVVGSLFMDIERFEGRKREHIQHALNSAHQATGLSGLDQLHLFHEALPDLDFDELLLSSVFLGQPSPTPFYISGMTAGHADAVGLNRLLAQACASRGWAFGVGSLRRDLESGDDLDRWKELREATPHLKIVANLGISQIVETSVERIRNLLDAVGAQALAVHANALQEALQIEGTPGFRGALPALDRLCRELKLPVVLKETGCGFSRGTLKKLQTLSLAALDVSGLGGTHWGRIEGARAPRGSLQALASETFSTWGESTLDSMLAARELLPQTEIWASGGVRSGLDAAKWVALGASQIGYAKPALGAALQGESALNRWMELQEYEFKIALFCTGCISPLALRGKEGVWKIRDV